MLSVKQSKIASVLFILIFCFFHINVKAQNNSKKIALIFPSFASSEHYSSTVYNKFKEYYQFKGFQIDPLSEKGMIVITNRVDDKIVLTVIWASTLSPNIMDFCVKNEVFYLDYSKKDSLTSEGKPVREYITKEFLSDYRKIKDFSLALTVILNENTFERELEEFISKNF